MDRAVRARLRARRACVGEMTQGGAKDAATRETKQRWHSDARNKTKKQNKEKQNKDDAATGGKQHNAGCCAHFLMLPSGPKRYILSGEIEPLPVSANILMSAASMPSCAPLLSSAAALPLRDISRSAASERAEIFTSKSTFRSV